MLDLLPVSLWSDRNATFLNPFTKSGVFLREIAKRLLEGLADEIPDRQQRIDHIFRKQLYGIAITELTSLLTRRSVYCSKRANGEYSIVEGFDDEAGHIKFERVNHTWEKGKCIYCRAKQSEYDRDEELETYAYQFIHTEQPEKLFDMRFDVIIGNPPYQLSDGGHGRSASPIYQLFVEQAKRMNPRYLSMIIPARWYAGGKGLTDFRNDMLNDDRIRKLVDFENSSDVFPGVDVAGGICYFLWDRDNPGLCEMINLYDGMPVSSVRKLNEHNILIRHGQALPIIRKVTGEKNANGFLQEVVSNSRPFGIRGHYKVREKGVPCYFTQRQGLQLVDFEDVKDKDGLIGKYKLLIPRAPIAGQTDFSKPVQFYYDGNVIVAKPGEICTESWLVAYAADTEAEILAFKSYLFTKTVRFLLLQTVVSQDVTRSRFAFIPHLGAYDREYTDDYLRQRWNITNEEWAFIDSKIR